MNKYVKIFLLFALSALLIFGAVACNDNNTKNEEQNKEQNEENTSVGIFSVRAQGINIEREKTADKVLEKLGDPLSSNYVASCGEGAGEQWVYSYSSIFVYTVKDGDNETVDALKLRDDTVATSKSIRIGADKTDVASAYGDKLEDKGNRLIYKEGSKVIEFTVGENGKVDGIELRVETN